MPKQKDFVLKGRKGSKTMIHRTTRIQIGTEKPDGTWEGPHPWNDDETIIGCGSPEQLRASQRSLVVLEF